MENKVELVTVEKEKLQKLLNNFYSVCGFCEELNIYEWEEASDDKSEMEDWVKKNFGRKII